MERDKNIYDKKNKIRTFNKMFQQHADHDNYKWNNTAPNGLQITNAIWLPTA